MQQTPDDPAAGPPPQYLAATDVMASMARFGRGRVNELTPARVLVLAIPGGGFITAGALFSVLLGGGIDAAGPARLAQGVAFSAGFFFMVLSAAVLFTEANVVLPTTLLEDRHSWLRVVRFWKGSVAAGVGLVEHATTDRRNPPTCHAYPSTPSTPRRRPARRPLRLWASRSARS